MGLTSRIFKEKENNPKQNQANNPISEWANETAQFSIKVQMANTHMKRCSTSLVIKGM